jgi:hypothetical protein
MKLLDEDYKVIRLQAQRLVDDWRHQALTTEYMVPPNGSPAIVVLVNLIEQFVIEWLKAALPEGEL